MMIHCILIQDPQEFADAEELFQEISRLIEADPDMKGQMIDFTIVHGTHLGPDGRKERLLIALTDLPLPICLTSALHPLTISSHLRLSLLVSPLVGRYLAYLAP